MKNGNRNSFYHTNAGWELCAGREYSELLDSSTGKKEEQGREVSNCVFLHEAYILINPSELRKFLSLSG
jgi:hypothetical protein